MASAASAPTKAATMSDEAARLEALDPQRSILLQAPAGSGKTTVLAQRFLSLLATVEEPEQVLAITFTRKAAAEMRERVLDALAGELDGPEEIGQQWARLRAAALRQAGERGWAVDELAGRLRIQTIDSLNHELARAMPVLGRFQTGLQVVDDAEPLYLEAARRTLRALDAEASGAPDADRVLLRLDNDSARAALLLASMLESRSRWLPAVAQHGPEQLAGTVVASLARIVAAALRDLQRLPASWITEGEALARASSAYRQQRDDPDPGLWRLWLDPATALRGEAGLPAWKALAALALTQDGSPRQRVDVRFGFPPQDAALKRRFFAWLDDLVRLPGGLQWLVRVVDLPEPQLPESEHAAYAALGRLLLRAVAELKLEFLARGRVDHAEVAAIARQALVSEGAATEQAIRQMLRLRHVLVDEFQDVSPDQLRLLETLTSDWSAGDGRSLFLVGDPMQSIYLFRNAEVGLFLRVRGDGVGAVPLEALNLARNFRSRPALVAWANEAFARILPAVEDARSSAVAHLPSVAARAGDATPAVTVWPLAPDDERSEGRRIAREIAAIRAATPAARVAILLLKRRLAPPILSALREQRIPVMGVGLAPLSVQRSVIDLVALGSALLHGADRAAWMAVLRSPFCGLRLADIEALAGDPGELIVERLAQAPRIDGLSTDARQRLARCAPLLVAAWNGRGEDPLDLRLRRLWRALGGYACCDDAGREAASQFLLALHRLLEQQPDVDGAALAALAARLRDEGAPGGQGDARNAVQVLTIHHSKGLEWDVVFVPGLGAAPKPDYSPLMRWLELPGEDGDDLLVSVRSIGSPDADDPLGHYIGLLQRERARNERARLAYVAATRARERLVLSGAALPPTAKMPLRASSGSLLDTFWPAVEAEFAATAQPAATPVALLPGPARLPAPAWLRVPDDFDPATGLGTLPFPTSAGSTAQSSQQPLVFEWVGPAARAAGTVVHEELERLARQGGLSTMDFETRRVTWQRRLVELGMPRDDAPRIADSIASRMRQLREDRIARWLLDTPHPQSHSELRLSGQVDGTVQNAVIDRCFVDQGQRWVVDYKTGTHGGGGLEAFVAEELQRYRPQLHRYRQLAAALGPEPVRAALYFPWLGVLRELED
jgi:ATP-dependent exoDNAse (exonuclease V) beta subunit